MLLLLAIQLSIVLSDSKISSLLWWGGGHKKRRGGKEREGGKGEEVEGEEEEGRSVKAKLSKHFNGNLVRRTKACVTSSGLAGSELRALRMWKTSQVL